MTDVRPVFSTPDVFGAVEPEPPTPAVLDKKRAKPKKKTAAPKINPADARTIEGMRRTLDQLDSTIDHLRKERDQIRMYISAAAATLSVRAEDGKDLEK